MKTIDVNVKENEVVPVFN